MNRCEYRTWPGRQDPPEPPETCDEETLDGSEYCADHLTQEEHDVIEDTWEREYESY